MTIGIFGGTFNPIHIGHLIMAHEVGYSLGFSKVVFVPSKIPPHKQNTVSEFARYQMVRLAIQDNPFFELSRVELDRPQVSYTVDTLKILQQQYCEPLAFIIGADNIRSICSWHRWQSIFDFASLAVGARPGYSVDDIVYLEPLLGKKICEQIRQNFVNLPEIAISSSEIRKRLQKGEPVAYFVPDAVKKYIKKENLYSANQ